MLYRHLGLIFTASTALASITNTFVVPHVDGADDAPAIRAALANFRSHSCILFEKGKTYNIWTPLDFGTLTNVEVAIEGNITLPKSIPEVQAIVNASVSLVPFMAMYETYLTNMHSTLKSYPDAWFVLSGTNVTLRGTKDPNWGWIDAHGQAWWDAVQQVSRPGIWKIKGTGGTIVHDIKIWKPIGKNWSLSGSNIAVSNITILAVSSTSSFPFNTVSQQKDSLYGARFKSWLGGRGAAINVTYKNIIVDNVIFPIYATQNYVDQEIASATSATATSSSTRMENFRFENFTGTIRDVPFKEGSCISDPCWYAVPGATGKEVIIFNLLPGIATNITTKNLHVVTETGAPVTNDVGFQCVNGLFKPT
ncbi:pectin lyase fold/virulence factor [Hysterangium stoloniferum]|nr:pectin lyase fold/virulence factor [Hysterangium stoloniferum]